MGRRLWILKQGESNLRRPPPPVTMRSCALPELPSVGDQSPVLFKSPLLHLAEPGPVLRSVTGRVRICLLPALVGSPRDTQGGGV